MELRRVIFFAMRSVFIFSLAGTNTGGAVCVLSGVWTKLARSKGETKVAL
jgi:hypothetical protein